MRTDRSGIDILESCVHLGMSSHSLAPLSLSFECSCNLSLQSGCSQSARGLFYYTTSGILNSKPRNTSRTQSVRTTLGIFCSTPKLSAADKTNLQKPKTSTKTQQPGANTKALGQSKVTTDRPATFERHPQTFKQKPKTHSSRPVTTPGARGSKPHGCCQT